MGWWGKIKKFTNKLTGGGAQIELFMPEYCRLREPIKGRVYIKAEEFPVEILSLKVVIAFTEKIKVKVSTYNSSGSPVSRTVKKNTVLYKEEIPLSTDPVLQENTERELDFEVLLPEEVLPSIEGEKAKFVWIAQAILERKGRDNKSKEIEFHPAYKII